jgi:hypothetical protein
VSTIADFRGRHQGERVAILANGPSLLHHDLNLLAPAGIRTMGMNASWQALHPTDYHVTLEYDHALRHPWMYDKIARRGTLFTMGDSWGELGVRIPFRSEKETPFSFDLERGAVSELRGVGSVAYVALQLAVWMGFSTIFMVGLDLDGPKFNGDSAAAWRQQGLFRAAASALEAMRAQCPGELGANCSHIIPSIYVVGSPDSLCDAFPKIPFDLAVGGAASKPMESAI